MSEGRSSVPVRSSGSSSASARSSRGSSSPRPRLKSTITATASACASRAGSARCSSAVQRRPRGCGGRSDGAEVEQRVRQPQIDHHPQPLVVTGLGLRLLEQPPSLLEAVVLVVHLGEQQQRVRAGPARRQRDERRFEQRPRPLRIARVEQVLGRAHAQRFAPAEPDRELQQLGGGVGRPAGADVARGLVEGPDGGGHDAGQREMARPLLEIRDHGAQSLVHPAPLEGARARVHAAGEQRVREEDAPGVELDHAVQLGRMEQRPDLRAERALEDRDSRLR